ncbi:YkvI family membrane protein [Lacrimispora xylanisolvens]|uniref:YkvI family membrane protein n=1 Tax=Lacrimispora xylanisolvens TaxID=384636 RepID=UPI002402D557|nr:hypothetical protein [Paenibacillaceae bacterium]
MIDKNKMPVAVGVAFVWFTTQFGGGFASGAQLVQYFVAFGIWALITPILAQAIGAVFQWYGLRFAKIHDAYDYRTFNNKFYGKFAPVFSNLYEIVYILLLCLAPSVAFATGGSTMQSLTGIPYMACTLIIGLFIFTVTIFGTDFVRKAASTLSVIIIAGLLIVYIPNIIVSWSSIAGNIRTLAADPVPAGPALWRCFIYASFQLASIGLLYQHAQSFKTEKEAGKSMIYGFIVNSGLIMLSTLGLMAVATNPDLSKDPLPVITLIKGGVGASFMNPMISILIILGAVSTAVNMIAGAVQRVVVALEKPEERRSDGKPTAKTLVCALLCTILAFAIAQFGLLPLVKVGYGYLGYVTIVVVLVPFLIRMIGEAMGKIEK